MSRHVHALTREQCVSRLSGRSVGRVSVSIGALPVVVPVDYVLEDDGVVFRAPLDSALAGACDGAVIAFEVDDFADVAAADARWSVHIVGIGSMLPNQDVRLPTARLRGQEVHATRAASDSEVKRILPQW
jgi:nitroimidazol reductase NimA-like FMN-containing flavoprotein (pyridoxamine 5'-phosphate oxidase superfamily)